MKKLMLMLFGVFFSLGMAQAAFAGCDANVDEDETDYYDYSTHSKDKRFYVPYYNGAYYIYKGDSIDFYNEGEHGDDTWWYDCATASTNKLDQLGPGYTGERPNNTPESHYSTNAASGPRYFGSKTDAGTSVRHIKLRTYDVNNYLFWKEYFNDYDQKKVVAVGRNNTYPVVLVHGFSGWGRDEVSMSIWGDSNPEIHYLYWGGQAFGTGKVDIEETLNNRNPDFHVYTASVGPITSVYDRACDLWAQLKGGDYNKALYGANHAAASGSAAYPHAADSGTRTYNNLRNTKGEVLGAVNASNPVHLIGHSMGGLTIRMLAGLLRQGSPWGDTDIWPGGQTGYIRSITTAATPHNGTTLTHQVQNITNVLNQWGIDWLSVVTGENVVNTLGAVYGLDTEQWNNGLQNAPTNIAAVAGSSACMAYKPPISDHSLWDMSPCGAMYDLNTWPQMQACPDIYYFSYSCEQSDDYGNPESNNLFGLFTAAMGNYNNTQGAGLDAKWRLHDGVVNTTSAAKPSCDQFTDTKESSGAVYSVYGSPGKWYHLDMLHEDHMDIIGGFLGLGAETLTVHDPWDQPGHDHDQLWGATGKIHGEHCSFNEPTIFDFWEMHVDRLQRLPRF